MYQTEQVFVPAQAIRPSSASVIAASSFGFALGVWLTSTLPDQRATDTRHNLDLVGQLLAVVALGSLCHFSNVISVSARSVTRTPLRSS